MFDATGSGGVTFGGSAIVATTYDNIFISGINKTITISYGLGTIDIEQDIYSVWKNWVMIGDNAKWDQAMRSTGGDPLPGGQSLGATFFTMNGWRIVVQDGVGISGNIFDEDGGEPFTALPGVALAKATVSTLVERITDTATSNASIFV